MLKNTFLFIFAILVSGIFAEDLTSSFVPREHRGFYNSVGFGIGYNKISAKSTWEDLDNTRIDKKDIESFDFWGITTPSFDFKFGTAIANLIAFHTTFNFAIYSGVMDYEEVNYDREIAQNENGNPLYDKQGDKVYAEDWRAYDSEGFSGDAVNLRTFVGFGTTIYPFRNPNSAMNGFFIGGSFGYVIYACFVTDDYSAGNIASFGRSFIAEIGKEWWVSNHLSIGIGFSYNHSSTNFDEAIGTETVYTLSFRLTRG